MPRPYNRYNQHRMTLNTAGYEPVVFNPIEFKPVEADYNILERSFAKQEERKQKALQQQTAVNAALAEIELAPEEDEWKQNYINNINNQIKEAASVGDYAGALNTATKLAGEVITDPSLRGRERYNKERKQFIEELKAKRDKKIISGDSYERAMAQNVYNYRDITDDNGNIVGGTTWEPEFSPRNDVNLDYALSWMKDHLGISSETTGSGGGTTQQFYDKDGNVTTDPSKAVSIRSTIKGGSRTESTKEVTADDWAEAYNAFISAHPELEADFNQLWENERWMYRHLLEESTNENLSEEDRQNALNRSITYQSSLTDKQGGMLSKDAWLLKRIQPSFDVMSYSQHSLVTEAGSTLLDETTLRNKTVGEAVGVGMQDAELLGSGVPMKVVLEHDVNVRQELYRKAEDNKQIISDNIQD